MEPVHNLPDQIREEIGPYERLTRGEFEELHSLAGIGEILVWQQIFRGLSQKEIVEKLGCHESQLSRDECNEYHNITLVRAHRLLDMLSVELKSNVKVRQE